MHSVGCLSYTEGHPRAPQRHRIGSGVAQMTRSTVLTTLVPMRHRVVCDTCDRPLYLRYLDDCGEAPPWHNRSGGRAYGNTCGCRLSPVPADALERAVTSAVIGRYGEAARFSLLAYARRLIQVRVGPVPEEVTCVWQ